MDIDFRYLPLPNYNIFVDGMENDRKRKRYTAYIVIRTGVWG